MISINGLSYLENFISQDTETQLLNALDNETWLTDLKRRVQHYGYRYDYKARTVTDQLFLGELPDWSAGLKNEVERVCFVDGYADDYFDQLIVNEYLPGQGIASHIDCIPCFDDAIVSLTLGSQAEMVFSNNAEEKHCLLLKPRALLIMKDDARYSWKHGIVGRKSDIVDGVRVVRGRRVSLTFRKIIRQN